MQKPLIIIGCSTESEDIASALQESLKDGLESALWSQLTTPLSKQILENLEDALDTADFAAFIFSPDDDVRMREEETKTVRDNVLLELGVARGLIGRDRAFIVRPTNASEELHIATDLAGISSATYDATSAQDSADAKKRALLTAANEIRDTARRLSFRPKAPGPVSRRVKGVLGRGSTESLTQLADAAIYVADRRHNYFRELRASVKGEDVVPSKYLYWTPQGSSHWLELCKLKKYQYYRDSLAVLNAHICELVENIIKATGTAQIDFVSVGSGNGVKDNVILRHLKDTLLPQEFIYYYPVDISDMLIVEAVRNALGGGLLPRKDQFKVKALIADFVKLVQLQAFYEDRPSPNLFSVLGNTVGNADEDDLMGAVADAMLDGDLVLMEVNVGTPSIEDPVWTDSVTLEHDFTPLAALSVPFDRKLMKYQPINDTSTVKGTQSILATYDEATIGRGKGNVFSDIKLSIVHYYDRNEFITHMQERMNVQVLWSEAKDDVCLVLAQRTGAATAK